MKESSKSLIWTWSASHLANLDGWFQKSDPYLVVQRRSGVDQTWIDVWRTEVMTRC